MNNTFYVYSPSLSHHGIKGQRWGVRRYQNPDGTLTAAGRRRVKKAMKQHEKVMMSGSSKRKQRKEYNKFKKMTLAMTDSEVKSLIENLQKDSAINSLTDSSFKDVKSKDSSKFIENGLKYAEQTARIISTISAMKNAQEINKYSVAAKKADILKAQATARSTNANAEGKEFENLKNRTEWEGSKKQPYTPVNMSVQQKYTPLNMSVEKVIFGNAPKKASYSPVVMNVSRTALPAKATSSYASSGVNYTNYLKNTTNSQFNKVYNTPVAALPTVSSASTNRALPTVTNSNYMLPRKT